MRCPTLHELPPSPPGKIGWPWTEESPQIPDLMPNGSEWPRISIVTPNYNYGHFIEETIRSVLLQGYPNIEYIVMDGASNDNSLEIIRKYEPWLSYWISEKDRGQSDAINKGFENAQGKVFYWINSDDILCNNVFQEVATLFQSNSEINFLTGDGCFFSETNGNKIDLYQVKPRNYSFEDLLRYYDDRYLPQPSVFFSQSIWKSCGGLDLNLSYAMDLDLWLKFTKNNQLTCSENNFSKLRMHCNSKTCQDNVFLIEEIRSVLLINAMSLKLSQRIIHFFAANTLYAQSILRSSHLEYTSGKNVPFIKSLLKAIFYCPWIFIFPSSLRLFITSPLWIRSYFSGIRR